MVCRNCSAENAASGKSANHEKRCELWEKLSRSTIGDIQKLPKSSKLVTQSMSQSMEKNKKTINCEKSLRSTFGDIQKLPKSSNLVTQSMSQSMEKGKKNQPIVKNH